MTSTGSSPVPPYVQDNLVDESAAEEVSSDESAADDEDLAPAEPALVHDHALDAVAGMDAARIAELYMKRIVAVDAPDTLVSPPSRRTAQTHSRTCDECVWPFTVQGLQPPIERGYTKRGARTVVTE